MRIITFFSAALFIGLINFPLFALGQECRPGKLLQTIRDASGAISTNWVEDPSLTRTVSACKEAEENFKKQYTSSSSPFRKACGRGIKDCLELAETCTEAAGDIGDTVSEKDRLKDCPTYAASKREDLEEKKKAAEETKKEREEEVNDLKEQIMTKQNEVKELTTEFTTFQKNREKQKTRDLEDLKKKYEDFSQEKTKQFGEIGDQITEAMNAIRDADIQFNNAKTKAYAECHAKAQAQLSAYRARRDKKIAAGTLSTRNGLADLVSQSGKTRKQQFLAYAREREKECRNDYITVEAIKSADTVRKENKVRINQQITKLQGMQKSVLAELQKAPSQADQEAARILQDAQDEITDKQTDINNKIQKASTEIASLQQKLQVAERYLQEIQTEYTDYLEMYQIAKAAGGSNISSEDYDGFMGAANDYENSLNDAWGHCKCSNDPSRNVGELSSSCNRLKSYYGYKTGFTPPADTASQATFMGTCETTDTVPPRAQPAGSGNGGGQQ